MRIRNLAKDPKAQKKMTVWGDCAATENDDGTFTYSPNRSPVSFAGLMDRILRAHVHRRVRKRFSRCSARKAQISL